MISLFRKNKKDENKGKIKPAEEIRRVIDRQFEQMEKKGIDSAIICLREASSKINAGELMPFGNICYSPHIFCSSEKDYVEEEKPYLRVILKFDEKFTNKYVIVEECEPCRLFLAVSKHWAINSTQYGPEESKLNLIIDYLAAKGILNELGIISTFNESVRHTQKATKMEMERVGVYKALEEMGNREHTPFEEIMSKMRENIMKAEAGKK
ncbi:MAG: hypothetical protein N3G76_02115 [Candidatus Micrarchaeota archaeon]|nr:hypothetical protein [Candidatus Micrarchaeota archaeon]